VVKTAVLFAGQFKTVLNAGPENLVEAYKEVIASKYSVGALLYRVAGGFLIRKHRWLCSSSRCSMPLRAVLSIHRALCPLSRPPSWFIPSGLGELLVKGLRLLTGSKLQGWGFPPGGQEGEGFRGFKMVMSGPGLVETVPSVPLKRSTTP